jgi:hypothetical protein
LSADGDGRALVSARIQVRETKTHRLTYRSAEATIDEGDMMEEKERTPWFLWPFVAIWRLLTWILELTGRLVAVVLGLVIMIVGVVISITVIGAIVGVPIFIFGLLLVFRGFF